ncbi:hypothetical protein BU15DRAFT_63180 [Melanogaster broomeanus]|nr:hypothetical protein BU15DRAFT_63180 [Melanogaster broomeanus]
MVSDSKDSEAGHAISDALSDVILPSPASTNELTVLERVNPGSDRPVSRFAPGVLAKFFWDHDAEVRALQWVHGPFYFFMEECPGVPLDTVIDGMTPAGLDHIADPLLVVLNEMHSYTSTTLGSVTGGPYNNRCMPYPWNPPHAFSTVRE